MLMLSAFLASLQPQLQIGLDCEGCDGCVGPEGDDNPYFILHRVPVVAYAAPTDISAHTQWPTVSQCAIGIAYVDGNQRCPALG